MEDSLIKIGIIAVEEKTSHVEPYWGILMNPIGQFTRTTNMTITHVWDKDRAVAESFARRYSVPRIADRYDEMVGQVDAVIMSGYKSSYWTYELVKPYLENAIPTLIDRPGAYSISGMKRLLETAKAFNCPVMVTDNHEHVEGVSVFRGEIRRLGPLRAVTAEIPMHSMNDYGMHGIHGVYLMYNILQIPVRRVSVFSPGRENPSAVMIWECEAQPDGHTFYTALHFHPFAHRAWIKVSGKRGSYSHEIIRGFHYVSGLAPDESDVWRDIEYHFFLPPLLAFQKMVETRQMPQTYEYILEKTRIFLSGYKSFIDHGGAPIFLNELPEDWVAPNPHPGYYPDGYFF